MSKNLIEVVRAYSQKIRNGRTVPGIFESLHSEVEELEIEVYFEPAGNDGIAGEAIDVILCALDLIFESTPDMTDQDIVEYAQKKCEKWAAKSG